MAIALRSSLATKVLQALRGVSNVDILPIESQLVSALQINPNSAKNRIELQLPLYTVVGQKKNHVEKKLMFLQGSEIIEKFETNDSVTGISLSPPESKIHFLNFHLDISCYCRNLLSDILGTNEEDYVSGKLFSLPKDQIIVEFSSPNIAKPFHVGHLRSTIHGNFLSNLFIALGQNVKRLNYLGDWGTQFGLLQFGLDQGWFSWEEISQNPIRSLLEIYVKANTMAEKDENVAARARELFQRLESGDEDLSKNWREIREFTVTELRQTYARLGVKFDEFNWESQYGIKDLSAVLSILEKSGRLITKAEGTKVVRLNDQRTVTLVKSDGSSLYLTRDVAAAIDRWNRFPFRRMFYVVDNAQSDHFVALKSLLSFMCHTWASNIEHVKFGRIKGMSTRKGTIVFLSDLLDEAHARMKAKQIASPNTRVAVEENPEITDILAISAVVINDLKQRRQRDYTFNWDDALQDKGDTGIRLQYTHSRLHSLEKMCGVSLPEELLSLNTNLIQEPELITVMRDLGMFHQVLQDSYNQLEPCVLVRYLFDLSHSLGVALKTMPVKNQEEELAQIRLAIFSASKRILSIGLKILGVQPLQQM
ncbi:probable arginine--tRNA ligase, mitochondrial [Daphnia carinata]|uniref:probable arginine--tRNA ligase, mitochondrial n=1 Tax=Daphnia carinata TaxID=120202 RepID=UPI00257CDEC3|nr:probable arginine--tRNA ligase, mitochondrial [Daphnia carinata]